jgi:hypothetical protein
MSGIANIGARQKVALVVVAYLALVVGGGYFGTRISQGFDIEIWPHTEPVINRLVITGIVLYILLTAIPFVPGIELGMALIVAFGARIVPAVYVATIAALVLSFAVGRLIPEQWLSSLMQWLGMRRSARLVASYVGLPGEQRIAKLLANAPKNWLPWLMRYHLVALGLLFNMPGSTILGGGGGIAMVAGISRLVSFPKFLLCAAIAVSPVPVFLILSAAMGN